MQFWKICGFSRIAFSREGPGGYPLSHGLRRASSPKGTPLRYAASFSATAKSRPLGEGGIAAGDDGRGTPGQAALCFSRKLSRYAKGSPFGRAGAVAPERARTLPRGGSFVPNSTFWGENRKRLSKVHKKAAQSLAGVGLTVPGRKFLRNRMTN